MYDDYTENIYNNIDFGLDSIAGDSVVMLFFCKMNDVSNLKVYRFDVPDAPDSDKSMYERK